MLQEFKMQSRDFKWNVHCFWDGATCFLNHWREEFQLYFESQINSVHEATLQQDWRGRCDFDIHSDPMESLQHILYVCY